VVAGLAGLAVAGVAVATRTATERRPVPVTAVVESTWRGANIESETGQRGFRVHGRVRYDVDHPGSARLAASVAGSPWLSPLVLVFGGLGLLLLAAAAINLAVETWSP
jgi:hypothetical protein